MTHNLFWHLHISLNHHLLEKAQLYVFTMKIAQFTPTGNEAREMKFKRSLRQKGYKRWSYFTLQDGQAPPSNRCPSPSHAIASFFQKETT